LQRRRSHAFRALMSRHSPAIKLGSALKTILG
jgi:hypothetical protein